MTEELSDKQHQAIALLLQGQSSEQIGPQLDVTSRTVRRWIAESPVFAAELAKQRAALRAEVTSALHTDAATAVSVVRTIMNDASVPAAIRLRAAQDVLDRVTGQSEIDALAERLRALEGIIEELSAFNTPRMA